VVPTTSSALLALNLFLRHQLNIALRRRGLSICRSIIEDHDGRLSARSGADQGSIFEIALPTGEIVKSYIAGLIARSAQEFS
jgi:light-regulated signal transduction histidine kinase (bacteriophytochrome)